MSAMTETMQRIAVIGNAAGGKSTLARALAKAHKLPYHEVDALFWQPDWSAIAEEDFRAKDVEVLKLDRWVLDGFGPWDSVERRFARADTIFLVDLPIWVHFWWAADRQIAWAKGEAEHVPAGHKEPPPNRELFEMIWQIDRQSMPRLRKLVRSQEETGTTVVRLTSPDALAAYCQQLRQVSS